MTTTYIGIDPDLHHTGIAFVRDDEVVGVECLKVPSAFKGEEAVVAMAAMLSGYWIQPYDDAIAVVEGQTVTFRTKKPESIVLLAQVAGACACAVAPWVQRTLMPEPKRWKGQVPKRIHQKRIYDRLGWSCTKHGKDDKTGYCSPINPPDFSGIPTTHWKHIGDAIGLALYGAKVTASR